MSSVASTSASLGSPSSSAAQHSRHLHSARNDDGVQCVPCFDALHSQSVRMYCGRLVGRANYHFAAPCSVCDGRCGPEGGCQCKSCARLNAEMARRERVSRGAAHATHVSFNKSAHAVKKGYQFYCGRTVGRGNYANGCVLCEGKCGPRTGCQCVDCHGLETQYQASKSRESSPSRSNKSFPSARSPSRTHHQQQTTQSPQPQHRDKAKAEDSLPSQHAHANHSFSGIALSPLHYSSDADSEEERALAMAFSLDLSAESIARARTSSARIHSIERCEDIETRLEELLHIVRQRKRTLIAHGRQRAALQSRPCVNCRGAERSFACAPCGHLSLCEHCALAKPKQQSHCGVCHQTVDNLLRVVF